MAQLIVRNLEDTVVKALRERAAKKGRSTEAEHREIFRAALATTRRATRLKELLLAMPDAGDDEDVTRVRANGRRSGCEPAGRKPGITPGTIRG